MKDFLKYILATVIGLILTGGILFFLSIVTLLGLISSSEQEPVIQENSILTIQLDGAITDRVIDNPIATLIGNTEEGIGLNDLLASIKKAEENERIKGIYIESGSFAGANPALLEEARKALKKFKQSGKFIIAYGDAYTQGEYYLCSVADKIILNPQGTIAWTGMSASPIFYKELLEKLGIEMQIFKVGTYKSAVEPFIANEMSEANREQVTAYLTSIWNKIVCDIATSRGLTIDALNQYANEGIGLKESKEFIKCGMADTLLYKDEVKSYLKTLIGVNKNESLNTVSLEKMKLVEKNIPMNKSGNIIAVYYAEGEIIESDYGQIQGGESIIAGNRMIKDLSRLREDEHVKAVVIRVNSPGGSAYASEQIWNEVVKLKAEKPVVISMSGLAASGGYYISCAADSIFAEATTLTGSIGIFGMIPNMENLLNNKLGLHFDVVKTNQFSDIGDVSRAVTPAESQLIQRSIERGYDLFITRCAEGRDMSKESIKKIAEGRVWTGSMAKDLGLVDAIGGTEDAILSAATLAGIEAYTLLTYPETENPFLSLLNSEKDNYIKGRMKQDLGGYYDYFNRLNRLQNASHIQTHIGFEPNIKL